jgi:hypothetical protein
VQVVIGPAPDVESGPRLAAEHALDAVVLDVRLERGDTIPLMHSSGEPTGAFFVQNERSGRLWRVCFPGVPVLRKLFRPEHLVAAIEDLLAKS